MRASFDRQLRFLIAATLVAATACARTGPQQVASLRQTPVSSSNEPSRLGSPSETVSGNELRAVAAPSLLAAMRMVRHTFLRPTTVMSPEGVTTSVGPSVYVNGVYSGEIDTLESIPLAAVEEVRFIRPTQARGWWGPECRCVGGVIHVRARTLP